MMSSHATRLLLMTTLIFHIVLKYQTCARTFSQCDAAKELVLGNIQRSFINTYVCIMKHESNFNSSMKKGPGHKASYSYGIFQISSDKWCSAFRSGGICNKKCTHFLDDDIQDDIACAKIIAKLDGFKRWPGWVKNCKNHELPNVSDCIRRDLSYESFLNLTDPEWMEIDTDWINGD